MKGLNVKLDTVKLLGETIGKNTLWHALQQYLFRFLLIQHVTYIPEDWELSVDTSTHRLELCTAVCFIATLFSPVMRLYILPRRKASLNAPSSPQKVTLLSLCSLSSRTHPGNSRLWALLSLLLLGHPWLLNSPPHILHTSTRFAVKVILFLSRCPGSSQILQVFPDKLKSLASLSFASSFKSSFHPESLR